MSERCGEASFGEDDQEKGRICYVDLSQSLILSAVPLSAQIKPYAKKAYFMVIYSVILQKLFQILA